MMKKLMEYCIWSIALHGAKSWTCRKLCRIYTETLQVWCWRRRDKNIWIDHVQNEKVLHRFKGEVNTLRTIKSRKSNWIFHILRMKCLLKYDIEGKIEGTERWGRRFKQLLYDLKEERRYCKLREEALDLSHSHGELALEYATNLS
jgi:hypothetical protein